MVRTKNKSAGFIKNLTSSAFYKFLNKISDVKLENNASDFFALTANAAQVLKTNYREKVRFLRGYVQNIVRDGQKSRVLTLGELVHEPLDMFTTVLIGNAETQERFGRMLTPRGYRL